MRMESNEPRAFRNLQTQFKDNAVIVFAFVSIVVGVLLDRLWRGGRGHVQTIKYLKKGGGGVDIQI